MDQQPINTLPEALPEELIVSPDDFETVEEYETFIEEHPTAEPAGATLEIGFTGIKIIGDYWFVFVVLLAVPLMYWAKKKADLYFLTKKAKAEAELGVDLDRHK